MRPQRYYVDVWEQNHNNWLLADDDIGFIETDPLYPNQVNYFTAWVDYIPYKSANGERPDKRDQSKKMESEGRKIKDKPVLNQPFK